MATEPALSHTTTVVKRIELNVFLVCVLQEWNSLIYKTALSRLGDVILCAMSGVQCTRQQFRIVRHTWQSYWTVNTGHPMKCPPCLFLMK